MLNGQKLNFRTVLQKGTPKQIKEQSISLKLGVLALANTYTGANFSNPPTKEQQLVLEASCDFILDMFPMISFEELKEAFKMFSAGKFDINAETYYGKFSVNILGKILKAYLKKRKNVLFTILEQERAEEKRRKQEEKKKHNAAAREGIIKRFKELKELHSKGELIEIDIFPRWAVFLRNEGLISFTVEQELEIEKEAREITLQQLKKKVSEEKNVNVFDKRTLISTISSIENGQKNADFEAKAFLKFKELLIKKAIIG